MKLLGPMSDREFEAPVISPGQQRVSYGLSQREKLLKCVFSKQRLVT